MREFFDHVTGKLGININGESWGGVLAVPGFSVGYKPFYALRMLPMVAAASFCAEVVTWA